MPTARCVRDYKFHLYSYTSWQGRPLALLPLHPSWQLAHKGIEPCCTNRGDFALPKPHRQKGRARPFEPSLYPRDQPFADWMPPLHGDQSFRTLNHDKESLQAPLDPMTKLTPFGLRQGLGNFPFNPAPYALI